MYLVFKISQTTSGGLLYKLHHIPTQTLLSIHWSCIAPRLTYGLFSTVGWGQACNSHLDKLLKLQKLALRFIYFSDFKQRAALLFIEAGALALKFSYF